MKSKKIIEIKKSGSITNLLLMVLSPPNHPPNPRRRSIKKREIKPENKTKS